MKTHLDKAKAALNAAKDVSQDSVQFDHLLTIAKVQAELASASALADIAATLRGER